MSIMRIFLATGLMTGSLHAGPWPHSISHLNQDPRDHVVLRREAGVLNGCGLQSSDFFRIRERQVLRPAATLRMAPVAQPEPVELAREFRGLAPVAPG